MYKNIITNINNLNNWLKEKPYDEDYKKLLESEISFLIEMLSTVSVSLINKEITIEDINTEFISLFELENSFKKLEQSRLEPYKTLYIELVNGITLYYYYHVESDLIIKICDFEISKK